MRIKLTEGGLAVSAEGSVDELLALCSIIPRQRVVFTIMEGRGFLIWASGKCND